MISEVDAEDLVRLVLFLGSIDSEGRPQYNIYAVPDDPDDNKFATLGNKGCILVQHGQIAYDLPTPSIRSPQWEQQVHFDITCLVGSRSVRDKRDQPYRGAQQMLQFVRNCLSGQVLGYNNETPVALYPVLQYFHKHQDNVYWYRMMFRATDVFKRPTAG